MGIKDLLNSKFLLFDGAMGTMLQSMGLKSGELPETYNILHSEIIEGIHRSYIDAGADVITTNTFQANELKLKGCPYSVEEIIESGVKIARSAGAKFVALDIGPLGQLMKPAGTINFERAYEIFKRQVIAGVRAGADIILIETLSDIYEAKAAILAAKENSSLPVFCTMTFQQDKRTFLGTDPLTAVTVIQSLGADVFGINCSLGPKELMPIVEEVVKYSRIPVMVQPNAGLPRIEGGAPVYDVTPREFSIYVKAMAELGVSIFGGCCGTNPDYTREVKNILSDMQKVKTNPQMITCASSSTKTVVFDGRVTVIGERINPTGKKKLKEALKSGNMDYVLSEAINQKNAGAHILDVNVGIPEIDEEEILKRVVYEIQSIVNLPLQIDSTNSKAIEEAVRIYNGKPIINSLNGKEEIMNKIFPIVKKYGACVIGLTMDEGGIPSSAEGRLKIAERIVKKAEEFKIPREDILIDCLVLTASAQQSEVMESLRAVRLVKEKLKVKTVLGVSNVSFGLPNRDILNRTYLAAALASGLDAPIVNPLSEDIMDTINAFRVLSGEDRKARDYVNLYGNAEGKKVSIVKTDKDLRDIIIEGRRDEAALKTEELLKHKSTMEIVDEYFIPALDFVGEKYERGEIFLPQLIQCGEAVKNAFEVIKSHNISKGEKKVSRGRIVVATVKGDIHDIGKNIAGMLLENYGFEVIDLGKDVDIEEIVRVVREKEVRLVGLSALMTTSLRSMEDTIKALRKLDICCSVMVGGAVLNEEYARMVGADFYARDAREGVKIANKFFNAED